MSLAPQGSDNTSAPASRAGSDTTAATSTKLYESVDLTDFRSLSTSSAGVGNYGIDSQGRLDAGADDPYAPVTANKIATDAATGSPTGESPEGPTGESTKVADGGTPGDKIAKTSSDRTTETTEPTEAQPLSDTVARQGRHSNGPSEPADMRLARSARGDGSAGGGGG